MENTNIVAAESTPEVVVVAAPAVETPAVAPVAPKASKPRKSKPKAEAKPKKRGRGRPPVYVGPVKEKIVALIREHGLTGTRALLADEGCQIKAGQKKVKIDISMPTLGKLAKKARIKLYRGRPAVA